VEAQDFEDGNPGLADELLTASKSYYDAACQSDSDIENEGDGSESVKRKATSNSEANDDEIVV
jgi:hypothetical protein